MSSTKRYRFHLAIPAEDYLAYYQQKAQQILVKDVNGITIQFPASNIQRFLEHNGIYGSFEMECDENNKLISINKTSD